MSNFFKKLFGSEDKKPSNLPPSTPQPITPPQNSSTGHILRDSLFGDMPIEKWIEKVSVEAEPWLSFSKAQEFLGSKNSPEAITKLQNIIKMPDLESRHYLEAYPTLNQLAVEAPPEQAKHVYGVVIEVMLPQGLDILAAYEGHHARYFNYAGGGVIWEGNDNSLDGDIDELIAAARELVVKIGVWTEPRLPVPPINFARLNILTPSGLHFGQARMDILSQDPMAGPLFSLGAKLMQKLIQKVPKQ